MAGPETPAESTHSGKERAACGALDSPQAITGVLGSYLDVIAIRSLGQGQRLPGLSPLRRRQCRISSRVTGGCNSRYH